MEQVRTKMAIQRGAVLYEVDIYGWVSDGGRILRAHAFLGSSTVLLEPFEAAEACKALTKAYTKLSKGESDGAE